MKAITITDLIQLIESDQIEIVDQNWDGHSLEVEFKWKIPVTDNKHTLQELIIDESQTKSKKH